MSSVSLKSRENECKLMILGSKLLFCHCYVTLDSSDSVNYAHESLLQMKLLVRQNLERKHGEKNSEEHPDFSAALQVIHTVTELGQETF